MNIHIIIDVGTRGKGDVCSTNIKSVCGGGGVVEVLNTLQPPPQHLGNSAT